MTKAEMLEHLSHFPDDAIIVAFDGDSSQMEHITGFLHGPQQQPFKTSDGEIPPGTYIVEICTDEP